MRPFVKWVHRIDLVLVAIVLLGLALRLWGINFGLPYLYHPDEGVPVNIGLRILHTGNLDPEFFNWPSLSIYLNALIYSAYFVLGRLTGAFVTPADLPFPDLIIMGVGKSALPAELWLGRALTAVVGTLSILWVYLIARRTSIDKPIAWLAALLLAVESVNVTNSHFIRPDTLAVFFVLWTVFFALRIVDDPRLQNYVLAGIGAGLATSSKYNLVFVVLPILVAHVIRFRARSILRKEIYVAALVSVAAFFLTTPYALLDWSRFWQTGLLDDAGHYAGGHAGAEGDSLRWYVGFLVNTQGWLLLLALVETIPVLFRRVGKGWVLLSFPLVYFVFISLYQVHFDTTILPVIPFIVILGAQLAGRLKEWVQRLPVPRMVQGGVMVILAIALAVPPLRASAATDEFILRSDGREHAREWIGSTLPQGTRIALEAYSPYVDRQKYIATGFYGLIEQTPAWYVANGYEYLVFSQGSFGRYFADPVRYADQIQRYNAFFVRFPLAARFDDNGYEIRIYKTGVTLPPHRVAVCFGDYGEHVELIGYDDVQWTQGEPLQVRLTWRTLDETPEPYEVELRLLGQDDREIAKTRGDLFQGKGWQTGMFDGTWVIPIPPETTPGQYRLQVNVIWMRYAYAMPALSWTQQRVDPVVLEPIEMQARP